MHKKNNFSKPFWQIPKIPVHFKNFHFLKVFFYKRDELSLHGFQNTSKTRFLKTATFGNKSSALTFLLRFFLLLTIITK